MAKRADDGRSPEPARAARRRREYGDFRELRAAHGLPEEPEPREEDWKLLRAGIPLPARPTDFAHVVRQRIEARPYAFGPMARGPAAYRDADADELALLWSFRVRTSWPEDVTRELASLSATGDEGRSDRRSVATCTIDGKRARDFDDAISWRALPDGGHELGVHIADVSAYVRPGSPLDDEALARATSVYLPDQVVPMLPELLSDDLCSLRPEADRRAYSVYCRFDARGHRRETRFERTWIRSRARLEYGQVQRFLDARPGSADSHLVPSELHETLRGIARLTRLQQGLRDSRGSLRMQQEERVFEFDADGRPRRVVSEPRYFAHALIEECALAANQAVGDELRRAGVPGLYRHHPEKDPDEVRSICKHLEEHGLRVRDPEHVSGREIGELVRLARRRPNAEALLSRIMGLLETAEYRAFVGDEEARHFGLARRSYLHFTSPIRRYPDLLVHRWLTRVLEARADGSEARFDVEEFDALCEIAAHCSLRSRLAEQAERGLFDLFGCEVLGHFVGSERRVRILRASPFGLEVRTREEGIDAFVPIGSLGRRHALEAGTLLVLRGGRIRRFVEGQELRARVVAVDFQRLQVAMEPL